MSISEAEEVPFQLLHGELVKHVLTRTGNDRVKALSDVESISFSSEYRLVEKITREHPIFKDELELMKFVCKDGCVFSENKLTIYVPITKEFMSSKTKVSNICSLFQPLSSISKTPQ